MMVVTLPRRVWIAVLLAAICPGLGHLYVGLLGPAVFFGVAIPAVMATRMAVGAFVPSILFASTLLGLAMVAALWLGQAVHAGLLARDAGRTYSLTRLNRVWVYLLFYAGSWVAGQAIGIPLREFLIEPFFIPASSMAPNLLEGDHVFVVKAGPASNWGRGDVVVYQVDSGRRFVKRVVALEGDSVALAAKTLTVDNRSLASSPCDPAQVEVTEDFGQGPRTRAFACLHETNAQGRTYRVLYAAGLDSPAHGPSTVGRDEVFLLGDHRDNSEDSRFMPPTRRSDVVGRAAIIWFSYTRQDGLRWTRMGTRL